MPKNVKVLLSATALVYCSLVNPTGMLTAFASELIYVQNAVDGLPEEMLDLKITSIPALIAVGYTLRDFIIQLESRQFELSAEEAVAGSYILRVRGTNQLTNEPLEFAISFVPVDQKGNATPPGEAYILLLNRMAFNGQMLTAGDIYQFLYGPVYKDIMARKEAQQ